MGNINLYNYSGAFMVGQQTLYCWPVEGEFDDSLNYLGTTVPNPNTNACVQLEFEIMGPVSLNMQIMFPTYDQVCVSVSVCVSLCLSICLSVWVACVSTSVCMHVPLCVVH